MGDHRDRDPIGIRLTRAYAAAGILRLTATARTGRQRSRNQGAAGRQRDDAYAAALTVGVVAVG